MATSWCFSEKSKCACASWPTQARNDRDRDRDRYDLDRDRYDRDRYDRDRKSVWSVRIFVFSIERIQCSLAVRCLSCGNPELICYQRHTGEA